jgi:ABC-type dipeptide/oligopeptide/nickel transport system ATPase component
MSLLSVDPLSVVFPLRAGEFTAVDQVRFSLEAGETLGIVGESGSGKSVCVSCLMGLVPSPPARISGKAMFKGVSLLDAPAETLRKIRGKEISMIFQDPMTSLNPYHRIVDQIAEPLRIHGGLSRKQARIRAVEAMEAVGIPEAEKRSRAWPHAFSGGMRQRVMIAMAMITRPALLIADEPTTALDVTVQRQILDLIKTLQREHGTAVLFISHDLAVVADVCEHLAVMRRGVMVEQGRTADILRTPSHPYTRGLLSCHPALHQPGDPLRVLPELLESDAYGVS